MPANYTAAPTAPYPVPDKLRDFRTFLYLVWRHLGLPDPTPIQLDLAYYMQHGPRRKVIEGFRGVAKSYIASTFVVWCLFLWPDMKFLIVSASKERADNFTTFTMRLIKEIPLLAPLIPRGDQRDSKISFDVGPAKADHSPSVKSVGIFGQLTGTRADCIIPDDIEVQNNSLTQGMRDKLAEAVKEFDAILKPGGTITYLGTPQTEQSIYNLLPERGYEVRIWPARYPTEKQVLAYGEKLAPYIVERMESHPVGTPTDPLRFDERDLMERELAYGRAGFALQFMLDTSLSDADRYPLKLRDLVVMNLNPQLAPEKIVWAAAPQYAWDGNDLPCVGLQGDRYYRPAWLTSDTWLPYVGGGIMAVDPSGRGKDETAYAIVKQLNGYLYVLDCGGLLGGYSPEVLERLAALAAQYEVSKILIEANFGDGMFTELFKPVLIKKHRCQLEEIRHSKQKELRIIDTLEPLMSSHRLIVDAEVIKRDFYQTAKMYQGNENHHRYQLMWQMAHLTRDRGSLVQDDRLDALAMAASAWVATMAQDVDRQIERRQERLLEAELSLWHDDTINPLARHSHRSIIEALGFTHPQAEGSQKVVIVEDTIFGFPPGDSRKTHNNWLGDRLSR